MNKNLRALFFDLDGTLVDTEPLKFNAHRSVLESHGGSLTIDDYNLVVGKSHDTVREIFLKTNHIEISADEYDRAWETLYTEQVKVSTETFPDAQRFLDLANIQGLQCVLVTSSDRVAMNAVLKKTGLVQYFSHIISADDVSHYKPDPEPYLKALDILGLIPAEAIIFEDSPTGYAAAVAAKIPVMIRRHSANKLEVFPLATAEFTSYDELHDIVRP